jgi:hypothetical protein
VNISASETIAIRLADATEVDTWYLRVLGTDELSSSPILTDVNPTSHQVTSPTTEVTFTTTASLGRSVLFESRAYRAGVPIVTTTFSVYVPTAEGLRVGSAQETVEGNPEFGWAAIINPAIRRPSGGGFTAGGDLSGTSTSQVVTGLRGRPLSATDPATGQTYVWDGSMWTPTTISGSFTPGGDLTGDATDQVVSFIRGIESMDPALAADNHYVQIKRKTYYRYPYVIHVDGSDIYVMEGAPGAELASGEATTIWKFHDDGTGTGWTYVAKYDTVTDFPTLYSNADMAWDDNYLYVATYTGNHVAIINKSDMTIAGWCYSDATVLSVCIDGSGGIYAYVTAWANPRIHKFILASCLGQPTFTGTPDTDAKTDASTLIRYGTGSLWLARGWDNAVNQVETSYLTLVGTWTPSDSSNVTSAIYALGSIWVTRWDWSSICTVARVNPGDLTWVDIPMTYGAITQPFVCEVGQDVLGADAIFVSDGGWNYRIGQIDPATNTYYGYYDAPTNHVPYFMASSPAGYLYAAGYSGSYASVNYINLPLGIYSQTPITYPYYLSYADVWQLAGHDLPTATPTNGALLYYNSTSAAWETSGLYGDLTGTYPYPQVAALRGYPVRNSMPLNGQVLTWNSTNWRWEPQTPSSGGFTAGGDLSGSSTSQTVIRIQNRSVSASVPTDGQLLQYSSSSVAWVPTTPNQMTVTLGESASTDNAMYLDESRDSASPGLRAYPVKNSVYEHSVALENATNWTGGPTQPYAYDACALLSDLYLVAYRVNVSGTIYLRLRAIKYTPGTGVTVGTAVDIDVDGASNEVAYVSCTKCSNYNDTYVGGIVAWANPITGRGYILGLTVSGTTITATSVTTFRSTAVVGTGLVNYMVGYPQQGGFVLAWADSSSNTGLSQWGDLYMGSGGPTLTLHGSPVTLTSMAAANIGQIIMRSSGGSGGNIWATFGYNERRVLSGQVSAGSSTELQWYYAGAATETEARVDAYNDYGGTPGYVLTSNLYGTGDFLAGGSAAHIITGTRAGFTDYAYLIHVQHGDEDVNYQGSFTHNTKVINGGVSTSWGASLQHMTLRGIGPDTFIVTYSMASYGNAMSIGYGRVSAQGGLSLAMGMSVGAPAYYSIPLGTAPQHYMLPFRITDYFYGMLQSCRETGGKDYLRFSLYTFSDTRPGFIGFLQSGGSRGDSRVITLPGGLHTFASTINGALPGQPIYITRYGGITPTRNRAGGGIFGILTGTANQIIVQKPGRSV